LNTQSLDDLGQDELTYLLNQTRKLRETSFATTTSDFLKYWDEFGYFKNQRLILYEFSNLTKQDSVKFKTNIRKLLNGLWNHFNIESEVFFGLSFYKDK
jgi:hypothetical protein